MGDDPIGGGLRGIIGHSISQQQNPLQTLTFTLLTLPLSFLLLLLLSFTILDPIHHNNRLHVWTHGNNDLLLASILSVYLILVLAFRVLSTTGIVYSIASTNFHSNRPFTLGPFPFAANIPYILCRVLVTYLWSFTFVFFLVGVFLASLLLIDVSLSFGPMFAYIASSWVVGLLFVGVLFRSACVFRLASIVSVLDQSTYGLGAINKCGFFLLKGRGVVASSLYSLYLIFALGVVVAFGFAQMNVVRPGFRMLVVFAFAFVLAFVDQMGMVAFTILYFHCKAYHNESVDLEHLHANCSRECLDVGAPSHPIETTRQA